MRFSAVLAVVTFVLAILDSSIARADLTYTPLTTEQGLHVLVVSGEFSPEEHIEQFARSVVANESTIVTFDSGGGSVSSAMALGRMIRLLRLNTMQIRQLECASACSLAFLGGVSRVAAPGSIGVHRSSFSSESTVGRDEAVAGIQALTAEIMAYLSEMEVSAELLNLALRYDRSDIRYLSASEMADLKVTTAQGGVADSPVVSESKPPAPEAPDVTGRKISYREISGDRRPIGWVYINVCSETPVDVAFLRNAIDDFAFASLRLIPGQIAQFDRSITPQCAGAPQAIGYVASDADRWRIGAALKEIGQLLTSLGINTRDDGKLTGGVADGYRIDIWISQANVAVSGAKTLEATALEVVRNLIERDGADPEAALRSVASLYADSIAYYGEQKSLREVLDHKRSYFARWPERTYRIRNESLMVNCGNSTCMVSGIYDWAVRSAPRNRQASGAAEFIYTISLGTVPKIVSEAGNVMKR